MQPVSNCTGKHSELTYTQDLLSIARGICLSSIGCGPFKKIVLGEMKKAQLSCFLFLILTWKADEDEMSKAFYHFVLLSKGELHGKGEQSC